MKTFQRNTTITSAMMILLSSLLLLLAVGSVEARGVPIIRVEDAATSKQAISSETKQETPSSSWMHANTNMTADTALAMEGCECTCDCSSSSKSAHNEKQQYHEDPPCSCSCKCEDDAHEPLAVQHLLQQERARAQRERRLHMERELFAATSLVECPGVVTELALWKASKRNQEYWHEIKDGSSFCQPPRKVNFEAIVQSCPDDPIESVQFSGSLGNRVENIEQYFLFGDFEGTVFGKRIPTGRMVIHMVPWSEDNAQGINGTKTSIQFDVVDCSSTTSTRRRSLEISPTSAPGMNQSIIPQDLFMDEENDSDDDEEDYNDAAATVQQDQDQEQAVTPYVFDFAVVGFPGAGGSHLLQALARNNATVTEPTDQCDVVNPTSSDSAVVQQLDETLEHLVHKQRGAKYSFQCPTAMFSYKIISRLQKHSSNAKLVVGLVHPVRMLEHLYNTRVEQVYYEQQQQQRGGGGGGFTRKNNNYKGNDAIPSFDDIIMEADAVPWKDVSRTSTQLEMFLLQLGKTALSEKDMKLFVQAPATGYQLAVRPNDFSVFLYSYEQIQDANQERLESFGHQLASYLGLNHLTVPPSFWRDKMGVNNATTSTATNSGNVVVYPETVDICQEQYAELRAGLVQRATITAKWIRDKFVASPDVMTANKAHFLATLRNWSVDPCDSVVATTPDGQSPVALW